MFEGSCVALVTPFKNGDVDEKKLEELVEFQIQSGTTTIVPCGTTGEAATLSHQSTCAWLNWWFGSPAGGRLCWLATGSNSTQEAIEMTRHAKDAGADGTLQVVPYYNKPTQRRDD